jgi:pimeloyl-ACP methyl ester carboxylesterase
MFDFASQAIFPTHAVSAAGPLPAGAERLQIATDDGKQLHGVHVPPTRRSPGPKTLILGFAGNAWNSQDAATYLHQIYPGADVVAFHYRGYRPSTGTPSAEALIADAPLVYDLAVAQIKPQRTVAVGFSIGTGVAAELASRRPLDGLILVTPFDSLKAAAADLYPMLPVSLLVHHEMDSAAALKGSDGPVALIAAAQDQLIGAARTEGLRAAVGNLVFDRTIERAGHNDVYDRNEFHQAMREALAAAVTSDR